MKMDSPEAWEKELAKHGLSAEIPTEQEKAAAAGVELVYGDFADPEAEALAKKLKEEDPRNVFGGFPSDMQSAIGLVETLRAEWQEQGAEPEEMRLILHSSCINDRDCLTLMRSGGEVYHYNLKNIRGYSRERLVSLLRSKNLEYIEK